MTRPDLRSYRYQQMRAAFLQGKTICHWCHQPHQRLTIDHLIPVALMHESSGLTPLDVENWVAACLRCNARRGAQLRNAMRKRKPQRPAMGHSPSRDWRPTS